MRKFAARLRVMKHWQRVRALVFVVIILAIAQSWRIQLAGPAVYHDVLAKPTSKVTRPTDVILASGQISLPILMYHYIDSPGANEKLPGLYVPPTRFKEQIETLKANGYEIVPLSALGSQPTGSKRAALTFDDGYADFYTQAWPILKALNAPATVYVITDKLDQPSFLTTAQFKELALDPLITIGSHTLSHPDLVKIPASQARAEIFASKTKLEAIIGKPVVDFCYPSGAYNATVEQLVQEAGYTTATT